MPDILKDKVSVVTGAGSGIGRSIAQVFAANGSKVYILEINESQGEKTCSEITADGNTGIFIHCDVSNEESVRSAIQKIIRSEKQIDILVNNAAVSHVGNIEQTRGEDLDRLYRINVKSVYQVTRNVIGHMVSAGSGVILNMASIASKIGLADRFAYSMSKGAVLSMTMSIAKDYIGQNIRCNCICPARVHTPFVDDYLKKNYAGREQEVFVTLAKYQPIGRMGKPEEIAQLALFLCSENSSFITGAAYDIDGGVMNLK